MGGFLSDNKTSKQIKMVNDNHGLMELTMDYLKQQVSSQTEIQKDKIRVDISFGTYGIDSVSIMGMTKSMEADLGRLSKTLFFEYDTVRSLAEHLINVKNKELSLLFEVDLEGKEITEEEKRTTINENSGNVKRTSIIKKRNIVKKQISGSKFNLLQDASRSGQHSVYEKNMTDDIAIIGIAGRYPMAEDLKQFWKNLKSGKDCVTEIPDTRWNHGLYFDPEKGKLGKSYAKWGGFLEDVEKFDPLFFNITPLEADFTDPQERLFLETAWTAFEEAGYSRKSLSNQNVGVFVGVMFGLYQLLENNEYGEKITGRCNFASIANRVSYFYNFHGPSIALDTMCSSSLTALHLACNSIKTGESSMAVVGGVNLMLHPNKYVQLSQGNFLSTTGKCSSFGEGGDGYVPGEGVGAIIIKPLKKAVEDGDHVYAVIKGTAINAGGKTSGYTVPNPTAQTNVIEDVLEHSGIDPRTITYVEAHGTGTKLGDPIEITGITNAYRKHTEENQYCAIGSVKSNIGHLESAAGVAAITKVILQMQHKQLVPSIHSRQLNPFIDFASTPFFVQQELSEWKQPVIKKDGRQVTYPRRAGISAFGAGGSNAHVLLEEYVEQEMNPKKEDNSLKCFVLSAKNTERLDEYAKLMISYLDQYVQSGQHKADQADNKKLNYGQIKSIVKESIQQVLKIDNIEIYDKDYFYELGMEPCELSDFCQLVQEKVHKNITLDLLAVYPNVETISEYLCDKEEEETERLEIDGLSLENLAYTLQVGRDELDERLAVIASDFKSYRQGLIDYIDKSTENQNIYYGNINDYTDKLNNFLESDIVTEYKKQLFSEKDYQKIAELWIMGVSFEWEELYSGTNIKRLSLPTYPFAQTRCWVTSPSEDGRLISSVTENKDASTGNAAQEIARPIVKKVLLKESSREITDEDLFKITLEYLKQVFSAILKIPENQLLDNVDFENYGLDSIYINQINSHLESQFGKLPSSLLFTYKNLKALCKYFVKQQREKTVSVVLGETFTETKSVSDTPKSFTSVAEPELKSDDIAIIGISGRYPKAAGLDEYLDNLKNKKDCITEIPKERWDYRKYPDIKCKWGGFIEDADKFDPQFFNITPNNAIFMDPQERVFLETVWSCLEDAGYTPKSLEEKDEDDTRGRVAVYAGVSFNTYGLNGVVDNGNNMPINTQIYSVANRISYLLNFRGPSLSIDSACSSSLYAIHMGCESILRDECDMAIAGGVNLSLHPSKYVTLNWGSFLASDGHCRSFGDGGDGYVPGEGVGAVLLKPLWQAQRDHDHIYGVIKGSAVNHGGKTNGYSVPNPVAQSEVIRKAIKKAKINPASISYIEAHGTGTALGDPIEIDALKDVFKDYTDEKHFCAVGSVKSNVGHLEAAAGIAQLTKVLLQFKSKTIFPNRLNSDRINHNIDFDDSPFYVQLDAAKWDVVPNDTNKYGLRRAGISSFGVGGVNVHVVVEEYNKDTSSSLSEVDYPLLFPFSARSEEALERNLLNFRAYIKKGMTKSYLLPDIRDAVHTMQTGRIELPYRVVFLVHSYRELQKNIDKYIKRKKKKSDEIAIFCGKAKSIIDHPEHNQPLIVDWENISEEGLKEAAHKWVDGQRIDYSGYHREYLPNKASLPSYSFERERYWLYDQAAEESVKKDTIDIGTMADAGDEIFVQTADLEEIPDAEGRDNDFIEELSEMPTSEKLEALMAYIQNVFADLLGFTEGRLPDIEQGFFDMGLESIETTRAYNKLTSLFGLELDMQLFFNYPNIYKLAEYILELLEEQEEEHGNNVREVEDNKETELPEGKEGRNIDVKDEEVLDDMNEDELAELLKGLL